MFSALDRKIELNRSINQNLEAMAKQLYNYWFVEFDFPNNNDKPYKSSGGKTVWNEMLKREIPERWTVAKIQDIAKIYSGGTPKSTEREYYENGNIPWINIGELDEPIITCTSNYITQAGLEDSGATLFPSDTILIALHGRTAGKVSLLSFEACSSKAICGAVLDDSEMIDYTRLFLSLHYEHFANRSAGAARDSLSLDTLSHTYILVPDKQTLLSFNTVIKNATRKLIENLLEIVALTKQRDELLPLLIECRKVCDEKKQEYK